MSMHRSRRLRHALAPGAALVAVSLVDPSRAALAADDVFKVKVTDDTHDEVPGDGLCRDSRGKCSLRAAVEEYNALGDPQGPGIWLERKTYKLSKGHLAVTTPNLAILGVSRTGTIIDAQKRSRVFYVAGGGSLQITDLTLKNGKAPAGEEGGGILLEHSAFLLGRNLSLTGHQATTGGAAAIYGNANLIDCTVSDNKATGRDIIAAGAGLGGGFYVDADGELILRNSTVSGNSAENGGGIASRGEVLLEQDTVSGNSAKLSGGGLWVNAPPPFGLHEVAFTTITKNRANTSAFDGDDIGGGGLALVDGAFSMGKSILAGNSEGRTSSHPDFAPDCAVLPGAGRPVTSFRDNIIGEGDHCRVEDFQGGSPFRDDIGTARNRVDPALSGLASNGGPTKTHAIKAFSPALDRAIDDPDLEAEPYLCPGSDQRGKRRPADGDRNGTIACDSGAYERQP